MPQHRARARGYPEKIGLHEIVQATHDMPKQGITRAPVFNEFWLYYVMATKCTSPSRHLSCWHGIWRTTLGINLFLRRIHMEFSFMNLTHILRDNCVDVLIILVIRQETLRSPRYTGVLLAEP